MTETPVAQAELLQAQEDLIARVKAASTGADRRFLVGVQTGESDWSLVGLPKAAGLPIIQWKLANLARLKPSRRRTRADCLHEVLGL